MNKQTLPDYIVRQDVVQSKIEEAQGMINNANEHLTKLQTEGIPTQLDVLRTILKNDEAFKEWLTKAESSYIGKLGFIPREEKERVHQSFADLIERTSTTRNVLNGFIYNRYGYQVKQDNNGNLSFDLEKIELDATEDAKKYFSNEDKEYFDLLQGVVESYKKVKVFEKEHDYVPYTSKESFWQNLKAGFSPYWFAFSWEIGKMSRQAKKMLEEMRDDE